MFRQFRRNFSVRAGEIASRKVSERFLAALRINGMRDDMPLYRLGGELHDLEETWSIELE
jgi:hypothetical protein